MKSITLGLALGLLGSVAVAQTPPSAPLFPAPAQKPPAIAPVAPAPQQNVQTTPPGTGQPAGPAQGGPPEGMIVETPNGYYLVRPGDANPRRLDLGQAQGQAGQGARMGRNDQSDDAAMDDAGDDGMQPPPPPPPGQRGPMPHRHPPEGKGARFRIRTPNLTLGMKCPDDEPIKACVDAVSQLLDKANAPAH